MDINYFAVLLGVVASMGLGFLWYSPALFGKPWMKLMGHTKESMKKEQKQLGKLYMLSAVASLFTAYMIAHVMVFSENFYHNSSVLTGITTAFFMWLGFVAPVQLTDMIFGRKNWTLFAINTGYQLTSLLVMGIIIGLL